MAIRIRVGGAQDSVSFACSGLVETLLSLHVLVAPGRHALQHPWIRAMQRLPPALKKEIAALSFLYRCALPACVVPAGAAAYPSFEDELARIVRLDAAALTRELAAPLRVGEPGDPGFERRALDEVAARHPRSGGAIRQLLAEPAAFAGRLAAMLEAYWTAAFRREWARTLEETLAPEVADGRSGLAERGILHVAGGLNPRVEADLAAAELVLRLPVDETLDLPAERGLVFMPSVYVWPDLRVARNPRWPFAVLYPATSVAAAFRRGVANGRLLQGLRALADGTRLRIVELLAERPRPTQELAQLIGMTEPGLSKHLRQLRAAGLVVGEREGYYVIYHIVPERVAAVADELAGLVPGEV